MAVTCAAGYAQVNAVDSEFTGVQQDDQCRLIGAMTGMVRAGHPLRTFMWGNKKSLWELPRERGVNIRERILEHYRRQYSASRMRLVVCSGQPLGELQAWAETLFASVRRRATSPLLARELRLASTREWLRACKCALSRRRGRRSRTTTRRL